MVFGIIFLRFLYRFVNNNGLPRNWPYVGMIPTLLLNIHRLHDKIAQILRRSNGLWFTNTSFLATSDPENVRYVLSSNSSVYLKGPEWLKQFDIFGEALFNSDGEAWKCHRRVFYAFLNHSQFRQSLSMVLHQRIEEALVKMVVNLQDLLVRHAFDIGCITGVGFNPGLLSIEFPENRFHKAMIFGSCRAGFRLGKRRNGVMLGRLLMIFLTQFISTQRHKSNKSVASSGSNEENDFNFLNCYLRGHEITGPTPKDGLIRDNLVHFCLPVMFNSYLVLLSHLQGSHGENKIRVEIKRHLSMQQVEGSLQIPSNYEELSKLTYLHAALCETLRLYPPVPFEFRTCTKQDFLPSGHRVEQNTRIVIGIHAMGRMESLWGEDCYAFKPERWIGEDGKIKRESPTKFSAFIAGPRICPGKEMSFLLMKATATAIIHNYNVHVVEGQNIGPKNSVLYQMNKGRTEVEVVQQITTTFEQTADQKVNVDNLMVYFIPNTTHESRALLAVLFVYLGFMVLGIISLCFLYRFIDNNGLPRNWPFVGMIPTLLLNIHRPHDKVAQVLRRSNGLWFTNTSFLATSDPENVRYVLSSNGSVYLKGPEWLKQFDISGEALFNSDGEAWKCHRRVFHAFLNHPQFRRSISKNRFHKAMSDTMEAAFYRYVVPDSLWKLQSWLQIGKEKKRSDAWKAFDDLLTQFILTQRHKSNKSVASSGSNEEIDFNFLNCYLRGHEITSPTPKDGFIRDNLVHFLLANDGTYSLTLTWFFHLISKAPMRRHLSMKQVEGILQIPSNYEDVVQNPKAISTGSVRIQNMYKAELSSKRSSGSKHPNRNRNTCNGRMESLWGEYCYAFKPERWIDEDGKIKRESPTKFSAFIAGPRICPGKEVLFLLMKATATAIIHNYNVHVVEGQNIGRKNSVLYQMNKGLMVRVKKRWS
ncbi:hypothetical protein CXB51_004104 [Gossypium anomalum]|uniref:Cytochrome P450 n=1 Tax=Gossypium anomalum TaxID=47600 RepID=A0A8J6D7Y7_9ROSI|nr:hypothetical protein CXB51_004104 [Gossypium anomalum]